MKTTPLRPFATLLPDIARRATAGAALRFILFFSLVPLSALAIRDLLVANPATNSILRR